MKKSKYMVGGGKTSKYKAAGGIQTGKEAKIESYNEYVKKMFGGGNTSEPAMKKKRSKGMARGGPTMPGMTGGSRPIMPSTPSMIAKKLVRPDPKLPRGKKGKGDI